MRSAAHNEKIDISINKVIGVNFRNKLSKNVSGTDLALYLSSKLKHHNLEDAHVEFFGDTLENISIEDRALIVNVLSSMGVKTSFFPIDNYTLRYKFRTGTLRSDIHKIASYSKQNLLWRFKDHRPYFPESVTIKLSDVVPAIAGPNDISKFVSLNFSQYKLKQQIGEDKLYSNMGHLLMDLATPLKMETYYLPLFMVVLELITLHQL